MSTNEARPEKDLNRSRRESMSSSGGDTSSLDTSLAVNRSSWIPDEEDQAELDRMAAEFEEAEQFELSIEVDRSINEDSAIDRSINEGSTIDPSDALELSSTRFATPSSVVSNRSNTSKRNPKMVLAPSSSSKGQKRRSLAARLAEDFLTDCVPKRRSLHEDDENTCPNGDTKTPVNVDDVPATSIVDI